VLLRRVFWKAALASSLLVSCAAKKPVPPATAPEVSVEYPVAASASPAIVPLPAAVASVAEQAASAPRAFRTSLGGISISGVSFDSRTHRLAIADQEGGPGSKWADAEGAAGAYAGVAALNAGFFTPEGKPLGLVVSGGKRSGSLNRSSLGAGFYSGGPSPALLRRERGGSGPELLQAGPFLVEGGKATGGLSPQSSTARSFIAWDGGSGWVLGRSGACSLAELARALAGSEAGGVKIQSALNLDGGRSSDLWISSTVAGGPVRERPLWNKAVRNFFVLVPRN
jgi:hypothetical protein